MAKKRKHSAPVQTGPREVDPRDGRLTVKTFEDVADSEDEFHIQRDKVLLAEGPDAKRRRKVDEEDVFLQMSDEEVLGYDENSEDDEDLADSDEEEDTTGGRPTKGDTQAQHDDEEEEEADWGHSRKDYYDADNIETEADALEEEAEAKRLQKKRLAKMKEADFGLDDFDWPEPSKGKTDNEAEDEDDVFTEVLKDIELTDEMGPEERSRLLKARYPEFNYLADEYIRLMPTLNELQSRAKSGTATRFSTAQERALAMYISMITMYFALFCSPTESSDGPVAPLDPEVLREHPVMDSIFRARKLWLSVKDLREPAMKDDGSAVPNIDQPEINGDSDQEIAITKTVIKRSQKQQARDEAAEKASAARRSRISAAEAELKDLADLLPKDARKKRKVAAPKTPVVDDDSDFGEEESLSTRALAEKAQKKKSLRFYTSQIAQKSNRRADAGRDAGGDADLPYRERLKDRQARLNAEAENRGKKLDSYGRGTALGDDSGDDAEQVKTAAAVRDDEDEYYDMVAQTASKRKQDKADKYAAIAEAKAAGAHVRITEGEVGEDGKRAIGYVIEKNKGLAPKRKKDVRNPRVKKRHKYEEKLKKLSSMKAVYKGGEGRGGYGGEQTGINANLVRSTKL